MIAYVRGKLILKEESNIVVDNNGIGYNIMVPMSVLSDLPATGCEVTIYTYMNVREDGMQLYGFLERDDLEMFKMLILVNGIGPKNALAILSSMTPDDLRFSILSDDATKIAGAKGVGLKTAQKLILELKDKVDLKEAFETKLGHNTVASSYASGDETVMALVSLGYSQTEAIKAVRSINITEDMDAGAILKEALKVI